MNVALAKTMTADDTNVFRFMVKSNLENLMPVAGLERDPVYKLRQVTDAINTLRILQAQLAAEATVHRARYDRGNQPRLS